MQVATFVAGNAPYRVDNHTDFVIDSVVNGAKLMVSGLLAQTDYYYYVRPICPEGEGPRFASTKSFRTACDATELPYRESFEGLTPTEGVMPECWVAVSDYEQGNPHVSDYGSSAGRQSLRFYSIASSHTYAVLPRFDIDSVKNLGIKFKIYTTYSGSELTIGVTNDPTDFTKIQRLKNITINDTWTWESVSYSFSDYQGDDQYIVLLSNTNSANYVLLDELEVFVESACTAPLNLNVRDVTTNSAVLAWPVSSIEPSWDLVIGAPGIDPKVASVINVTTNLYPLSGLQQGTAYDVYVRSNCGAGEVSSWFGPVSFTTLVPGDNLPFVSDFETGNGGWTILNGSQTNAFHVGSAVSSTGSSSLYISNDNGTSNEYSEIGRAHV